MSTSVLGSWLVRCGLVLAMFLGSAAVDAATKPPVRRPTAPEILEATIITIDQSVTKATDRIEVLGDRGIFRLERAALKGAPQATLEKTASKAKKDFPGQARKALAQVNRDVSKAMIQMRSAEGYTNDLQDDLFFERETAIADLEDAIAEGETRIDEALAELLAEAAAF